jgi:hypothetical protein
VTDVVVDTVRASRDGHQYHEAWLARRALGLLLPRDELCGIAVEGLSQDIEEGSTTDVVEIADATFFYGKWPSFERSLRIVLTQFKYSIARQAVEFRFSDLRKTIKKFATAESSFIARYGEEPTRIKFRYAVTTNRPISPDLAEGVAAAAEGREAHSASAQSQLKRLRDAIKLPEDRFQHFCSRLELIGSAGSLRTVERANAALIADWSASNDALARARLGDLRQLVRDKAGSAGQKNNIVEKVDILAVLGLGDESDLLPTPEAFPDAGPVVDRVQLDDFIARLGSSGRWLIHATGGVGKTVFVQSLAGRLRASDEVVLFDCFGGGAYRSPIDGRHRPERGLLHIVNELACRGLCDPLLPSFSDPSEVIRKSVQRFGQAITAMRRTRPEARLIVIMDAVDNAGKEAESRGQPSFPKELLEGLTHLAPIEGLVVIATTRPEREKQAIGTAQHFAYQLKPFALTEAGHFIRARRPEATQAQIEALHRRADGNPRVIANLIEPDRSLAGEAEIGSKVVLDTLIEERIDRAIKLADEKGAQADTIAAFLCALSKLPPPVPIEEMAVAFGLQKPEIESLATDLSPLLERTRLGLIFRDEPTETLVGTKYGAQLSLLNDVVLRLGAAQDKLAYAARALPGLLFAMDRVEELHKLAFDNRFPPELDSDVAKRGIRLNRLKTALGAAAKSENFDAAVDLLVELSSIVLVEERGQDYLTENPDLVVALGDTESLRRLFEDRTSWQGTRHARLAVAYTTDGDTAEAYGHAVRANEWVRWAERQDERERLGQPERPAPDDYVAIAYFLLASGRFTDVARYLTRWQAWYGYKLAKKLFMLCAVARAHGKLDLLPDALEQFCRSRKPIPALIAAALSVFPSLGPEVSGRLIQHLAGSLKEPEKLHQAYEDRREGDSYQEALLRCGLRAAYLQLWPEALVILNSSSVERYRYYSLRDQFHTEYIVPWILSAAGFAAANNRPINFLDALPLELWKYFETGEFPQERAEQEKFLFEKLKEKDRPSPKDDKSRNWRLSDAEKYHAGEYVRERIDPILTLTERIRDVIGADSSEKLEKAIREFFGAWRVVQESRPASRYVPPALTRFLNNLYARCALLMFSSLGHVNARTAPPLAECLDRCEFVPVLLRVELVRQLAAQAEGHVDAGKMAVKAVQTIEQDDEVTSRARLFAQLARAIFPANHAEAAGIFKRGLTELDALGSGDYQFTNELLAYAASVRGGPTNPSSALRLAKICELNNYDSHKFPWPLTAKAFSRIWGLRFLAQIARWHDRDKADLELTLAASLTFLIRDRHLVAEDAVPLLGLVDVVQMWDWGWQDIFDSLIGVGADIGLFEFVLDLYERDDTSGSYYRLKDIRKTLAASPEIFERLNPDLERLKTISAQRRVVDRNSYNGSSIAGGRSSTETRAENEQRAADAASGIDPLERAALESLVERIEQIDGALDTKRCAFGCLRANIPYPDRIRHIEALIEVENLELFSKIALLEDTKAAWLTDSPSGLEVFRRIGPSLIRSHAAELVGKSWGFNSDLNELAELSGTTKTDLAAALVESATSRGLDTAAPTWLSLACILSVSADAAIPRRALERLMENGAARLADEVGDGPWRSELDPGSDPTKVVAGLVWFCLGSPDAAQRWRAAHVVRHFAAFRRWQIIGHLFSLFDNAADGGAFQDRNLPFFGMHARFWFLLAVSRVARDHPQEIAAFAGILERFIGDDAFPHVGMRDVARRALVSCLDPQRDAAALARLSTVNQSMFARIELKDRLLPGFTWQRPDTSPRPKPVFSFEYDFDKYELERLGRMFGLPPWVISDQCVAWVRKWDQNVSSMYEFSGRRRPGRDDYSAGTRDDHHSYGTYLAWHALALAAGNLLQECRLVELRGYETSWEEWLLKYSITRADGLWLADGTEKYPPVAFHDLLGEGDNRGIPIADQAVLLSLSGINADLSIGNRPVFAASWNSPDNVNVSIVTAFVPESEAELAARAIATAPPFHMWLPSYRSYDEDGRFDDA